LNKDSREIIHLCIGLVGTLAALVFWLSIIFGSLALFSPGNATVRAVMMVCALSTSGAIFLILEMDRPFSGWISISTGALSHALAAVGR
jgi:hypothetical protein